MGKSLKTGKEIVKTLWTRLKYFFLGYYIPIKYIILQFFTAPQNVDKSRWNSSSGKVAVVTGANRGIGFNVVAELLRCNCHVILAVRDVDAGDLAVQEIRNRGILSGSTNVCLLDLSSLTSVRQCVEKILKENEKIHLLINNAAVGHVPEKYTEDGLQLTFQINYLGHFLLTNLMLTRMNETGKKFRQNARIVNVASVGQYGGDLNLEDLQNKKNFIPSKAYFDSKLAVVISTKFLAMKFKQEGLKVQINCLHPGISPTNLFDSNKFGSWMKKNISWIFPPINELADRVVNVALSSDLENTNGEFFVNNQLARCNTQANDNAIRNKLWKTSLKLSQLPQ